jgi:multidrug resistance efflux pump
MHHLVTAAQIASGSAYALRAELAKAKAKVAEQAEVIVELRAQTSSQKAEVKAAWSTALKLAANTLGTAHESADAGPDSVEFACTSMLAFADEPYDNIAEMVAAAKGGA